MASCSRNITQGPKSERSGAASIQYEFCSLRLLPRSFCATLSLRPVGVRSQGEAPSESVAPQSSSWMIDDCTLARLKGCCPPAVPAPAPESCRFHPIGNQPSNGTATKSVLQACTRARHARRACASARLRALGAGRRGSKILTAAGALRSSSCESLESSSTGASADCTCDPCALDAFWVCTPTRT